MRHSHLRQIAILTILASGCGQDLGASAVPGRSPLLGKADSGDQADRSCRVVLRSIGRQPGGSDYQTQCTGPVCNYLWTGIVEVAEGLQGTVRVLYHRVGDPSWWQVDATPAPKAQPGFTVHDVRLHEHLFGPSTAASDIELMPFLELPDGSRLFDHNRRPGALENYVLQQASGHAVGADGVCAPVVGRVSFLGNWDELVFGELRQQGHLVVDYALDRLLACRGTHNGAPAWDMVAHARFLPGGQEAEGSVRVFESPQGVPTNVAHSQDLTLEIPSDATSVELWFQNFTGAGSSCSAWDSDFGKNYRFEVWPPASDPRCQNVEVWSAVASDLPYRTAPYCLAYTVDKDLDAGACDLFLSSLGNGYVGHYGIPSNWVEATLEVGALQGQVLGVGMFVRLWDPSTSTASERILVGRQVAPSTWQTGLIYHRTAVGGMTGYHHDVQQLAFFVDVRQPAGEVVRLWQSRHGKNYGWSDAFSLPTSSQPIAYGNIQYAAPASPIFDARRACGK